MLSVLAAVLVYQATVLKVIDGDTLKVHIEGWPAPFDPISVRVFGIDTPEHVMPPAQGACEVALGNRAKAYALTVIKPGDRLSVAYTLGVNDKYGRLLGRVTLANGKDYGQLMVNAKLARAYGVDGKLHKTPWC